MNKIKCPVCLQETNSSSLFITHKIEEWPNPFKFGLSWEESCAIDDINRLIADRFITISHGDEHYFGKNPNPDPLIEHTASLHADPDKYDLYMDLWEKLKDEQRRKV